MFTRTRAAARHYYAPPSRARYTNYSLEDFRTTRTARSATRWLPWHAARALLPRVLPAFGVSTGIDQASSGSTRRCWGRCDVVVGCAATCHHCPPLPSRALVGSPPHPCRAWSSTCLPTPACLPPTHRLPLPPAPTTASPLPLTLPARLTTTAAARMPNIQATLKRSRCRMVMHLLPLLPARAKPARANILFPPATCRLRHHALCRWRCAYQNSALRKRHQHRSLYRTRTAIPLRRRWRTAGMPCSTTALQRYLLPASAVSYRTAGRSVPVSCPLLQRSRPAYLYLPLFAATFLLRTFFGSTAMRAFRDYNGQTIHPGFYRATTRTRAAPHWLRYAARCAHMENSE